MPPNVPYPPLESPLGRMDAGKNFQMFAKRFQELDLDGHGVEMNRTPYGSGYNNMPILDMKTKITDKM